jgi:hypothetical protein
MVPITIRRAMTSNAEDGLWVAGAEVAFFLRLDTALILTESQLVFLLWYSLDMTSLWIDRADRH